MIHYDHINGPDEYTEAIRRVERRLEALKTDMEALAAVCADERDRYDPSGDDYRKYDLWAARHNWSAGDLQKQAAGVYGVLIQAAGPRLNQV
ncbi:MAG: hypothetical protein AAFU38_14055 [Bacteroidota bacterium]